MHCIMQGAYAQEVVASCGVCVSVGSTSCHYAAAATTFSVGN